MNFHLTTKQERMLQTITTFLKKHKHSPTLRELQQLLDIRTKRGVVQYLEALEKKGFIKRSSNTRGIYLTEPNSTNFLNIPILGFANAGEPLVRAEEERLGDLKIERTLLSQKQNLFAVVVKGDSMNQKKINSTALTDSAYAIVARNNSYSDGDTVLAIIDEGATIKSYKKTANAVILYPQSDNPRHQPIYLSAGSDAYINGKVIYALENPISSHT